MKLKKTNALRRMLIHNKAVAGMDFLQEFVIGLFIVIVLIFIIAIIGANLRVTSYDSLTGTVVNESGWVNRTGYTVFNSTKRGFSSFTITAISNETRTITAANYTVFGNGTIFNATAYHWNDANISYTFGYTQDTLATSIIANLTIGIATLSSSVPTWVTMAGLVVLMAIMAVIIVVVKRLRGAEGGAGNL